MCGLCVDGTIAGMLGSALGGGKAMVVCGPVADAAVVECVADVSSDGIVAVVECEGANPTAVAVVVAPFWEPASAGAVVAMEL